MRDRLAHERMGLQGQMDIHVDLRSALAMHPPASVTQVLEMLFLKASLEARQRAVHSLLSPSDRHFVLGHSEAFQSFSKILASFTVQPESFSSQRFLVILFVWF